MPQPTLRIPGPDDAAAWFDFLVTQQAAAYTGIVPSDFAARQRAGRQAWIEGLVAKFTDPGTASRVVAEVDGRLVGIASVVDGPAPWELAEGYVPAPAARELSRLYLAPEFHGTGLAQQLLATVDDGRDLYLWLIDGNERAQRFYRRHGFVDLAESFAAGPSWGNVAMHRMRRTAA